MLMPHPKPDISVVICTRNRACQLAAVLDSAAKLRLPPDLNWELIVVDNGSSDNTGDVARGYLHCLPIRVVREDVPGLSNARNRGVSEAVGGHICWTDDDVILDPEWLGAYWQAFRSHPEAAIFGGQILPDLEPPTPRWFSRLANEWPLTNLLAKRDFGDQTIPLNFKEGVLPWGANFALRMEEQRAHPYEPGLGVSPNQRRLGEESEVIFKIMMSGGQGWWIPDAKVRHKIPRQRQTWNYIYEYFRSYGETLAFMEETWPGTHHLSADRTEVERVRMGKPSLHLRGLLYRGIYAAARAVGANRHAVLSLAKVGFYVGAAQDPSKAGQP